MSFYYIFIKNSCAICAPSPRNLSQATLHLRLLYIFSNFRLKYQLTSYLYEWIINIHPMSLSALRENFVYTVESFSFGMVHIWRAVNRRYASGFSLLFFSSYLGSFEVYVFYTDAPKWKWIFYSSRRDDFDVDGIFKILTNCEIVFLVYRCGCWSYSAVSSNDGFKCLMMLK